MSLFIFPPVQAIINDVATETTLASIESEVVDIAADVADLLVSAQASEALITTIDSNLATVSTDLASSLVELQTINTKLSGSLVPLAYDEIQASFPTTSSEVYAYYASSVLIKTITVTFTDATKTVLVSVVAS